MNALKRLSRWLTPLEYQDPPPKLTTRSRKKPVLDKATETITEDPKTLERYGLRFIGARANIALRNLLLGVPCALAGFVFLRYFIMKAGTLEGMGLLAAPLFGLIGLGGVAMTVNGVWRTLKLVTGGYPRAPRSPEGTVRQFFSSCFHPDDYHEAFVCLLNSAKAEVGGFDGFSKHWKRSRQSIEDGLRGRYSGKRNFEVSFNVEQVEKLGGVDESRQALSVVLKLDITAGPTEDKLSKEVKAAAKLIEHVQVVQRGHRFYLTSGRLSPAKHVRVVES